MEDPFIASLCWQFHDSLWKLARRLSLYSSLALLSLLCIYSLSSWGWSSWNNCLFCLNSPLAVCFLILIKVLKWYHSHIKFRTCSSSMRGVGCRLFRLWEPKEYPKWSRQYYRKNQSIPKWKCNYGHQCVAWWCL